MKSDRSSNSYYTLSSSKLFRTTIHPGHAPKHTDTPLECSQQLKHIMLSNSFLGNLTIQRIYRQQLIFFSSIDVHISRGRARLSKGIHLIFSGKLHCINKAKITLYSRCWIPLFVYSFPHILNPLVKILALPLYIRTFHWYPKYM